MRKGQLHGGDRASPLPASFSLSKAHLFENYQQYKQELEAGAKTGTWAWSRARLLMSTSCEQSPGLKCGRGVPVRGVGQLRARSQRESVVYGHLGWGLFFKKPALFHWAENR